MTVKPIILPDGTKCYSGPGCRRHGVVSNVSPVSQQLKAAETQKEIFSSEFQIEIPTVYLDEAIKKIDAANRKLARYGVKEKFNYSTETFVVENESGDLVEFTKVIIDKPRILVEGYTFEAVHQFAANGGIVSFYQNEDLQNTETGSGIENYCDHCGSTRPREKIYWVKDTNTGERKQVGSSCLKGFFGVSPTGLWSLSSKLGLEDLEETSNSVFFNQQARVYEVKELIAAALKASNNGDDFVTKAQEGFGGRASTADKVLSNFRELRNTSREINNFASELVTYAREMDPSESGYASNISEVFKVDAKGKCYIKHRHVPLAISVIKAYKKEEKRSAEKAELEARRATEKRSFLAPKGEKIFNIPAKIESVKTYEGHYGVGRIYTLKSDAGYVMTWFTSSGVEFGKDDTVNVTRASVKDNTIYNDSYQTVLTRVKLEARN